MNNKLLITALLAAVTFSASAFAHDGDRGRDRNDRRDWQEQRRDEWRNHDRRDYYRHDWRRDRRGPYAYGYGYPPPPPRYVERPATYVFPLPPPPHVVLRDLFGH